MSIFIDSLETGHDIDYGKKSRLKSNRWTEKRTGMFRSTRLKIMDKL